MNVRALSSISNWNDKEKNEAFFEEHLHSFLKSYGKMKIEDAIWFGLVHPDKIRSFIICNFIKKKMLSTDLAVCEIQKRAASKYGISLRTVQKMWSGHLNYERSIKK